jgi:ribosomal RNA assembly protein
MIRTILIPTARVGVLIGHWGDVKKRLQKRLGVKLSVSDGEVVLKGEDALTILTAENIVRAIGRGFSPPKAFRLLDEETTLEIIGLPEEERTLRRVRSRLIGDNGKARRNIERLTSCFISVYGKTVSIIGRADAVDRARQSIEMLIKGSAHRNVWAWLERRR